MARIEELVDELDTALAHSGTPERAVRERTYLRSELTHHGVPVPEVRRLTRALVRGEVELWPLVDELWRRPVHECRLAAVEALMARVDELEPEQLGDLEQMIRQCRTWALLDPLAIKVVGPLVETRPELLATLDRWIDDPDFWVRRSAMLALLLPLRRGGGELDRFFAYADRCLDEREFFVAKAIGWVLREIAGRRPDAVFDWLAPRAERASAVTVREAVKRLSPDQAAAIDAARR